MPIDDQKTFTVDVIPSSAKRIKKWSVCYADWFLNDTDNQIYMANHFDLINVAAQNNFPLINQAVYNIKALNPNILALMYKSTRGMHPIYADWNVVNSEEDWFLHTLDTGERIRHCTWNSYLMNISPDAGWTDHYANIILDWLTEYAPLYDGIFGDSAHPLEHKLCRMDGSTPVPNDQVDPPDIWEMWPEQGSIWINAIQPHHWMYQHLQNAKNTIGDYIYMGNSSQNYLMAQNFTGWHMYEGFIHAKSFTYNEMGWPENVAKQVIEDLHWLAKLGVNICVVPGLKSGTPTQNADWCKRVWCFFAFVVDDPDKAWFAWNFCHNEPSRGWFPVMDTELGTPIDDYVDLDELKYGNTEIYIREFQNAIIAINNSRTNTYTANINGTDYTLGPRQSEIIQ